AGTVFQPPSNPDRTPVPWCVNAPPRTVGCVKQKRNIPRSTPRPPANPGGLELRPDHAFVLHLDLPARLPRRVVGRAEHVTSGRVAHVTSLSQLIAFMAKVLRDQNRRGRIA